MFSESFSPAGYINKQGLCGDAPYGKKTVAYCGCGAIACYNLMKLLGLPCPWETVKASLERSVILGGRLGTGPWGVSRWLREQGVGFQRYLRPAKAAGAAAGSDCGILLYAHRKGLHYVAYRGGGEKLHFYNVSAAEPEVDCTMAEFIKNRSIFPLICLFTVNAGL